MKVAILERDYLPDPPTPSNKAFPYGYLKILAILDICSQASKNITNFIYFLEPPLYEVSELYSS
jgi:hypothetical protein